MFHDLVFEIWSHMEKLDTPLPLEKKSIIFTPDEVSTQKTDDTPSTDLESGITETELYTQEANDTLITEEHEFTSAQKKMKWVTKIQLEQILNEQISVKNYEVVIHRLKKLSRHERAAE